MSSKAAEARESFLRRLEQQQQQNQEEKDDKKEEEKNAINDNTVTKSNNVSTLESAGAEEKEAAVDTTAKSQSSSNDPITTPSTPFKDDKAPPSTATTTPKSAFQTPSKPTNENDKEEELLLNSIVKSCGLSQISDLNNVDPSSLQLLRALSTPRIKRRSQQMTSDEASKKGKSTSKKGNVRGEKEDAVARSLDFGVSKSSSNVEGSKEEEGGKKALPPLNEIAVDQTVALNRATYRICLFFQGGHLFLCTQ